MRFPGDQEGAGGGFVVPTAVGVVMKPGMPNLPTQPDELAILYRHAFKAFGARALWNMRPVETPTPADALAITQALRTHGQMDGRRLAERIEALSRADH